MVRVLLIIFFVQFGSIVFCQRGVGVLKNNSDSIGTNYALVMGISHYAHVKQLNYAHEDAFLFADYLVSNHICLKSNVKTLIDSMATSARFYEELERLLNSAKPNERVFIYFAGHGDVETRIQSGFLITYNSEAHNYPATNIDVSMLDRYINAFVLSKVKVVLIIDACHGMAGSETTLTSITDNFKNTIKILSCQPNELSGERYYPGGGHGIFTYHLVNGLNGLADKNGKHYITVDDIEEYLSIVKKETNQKQHAKVYGDGNSIIANYDEAIKQITLRKTNVGGDLVVNRSLTDSSIENNIYYQKLNEQIRTKKLIEPVGNNAYNTIEQAIIDKQPEDIVKDMKLKLAAELEDDAQIWLNKYLQGDKDSSYVGVIKQSLKVKRYLEAIEGLMGGKALRYNEIHVKKLFFGAIYDYYDTTNKEGTRAALDSLETANKLIPNQAWVLNLMTHCYEDLKQNEKLAETLERKLEVAPHWRSNLYVLAIGISDYDIPGYNLAFAAKDATDFANTVAKQKGKVYQDVFIKKLINKDATRDSILHALEWIHNQTRRNDVVMIYFNGIDIEKNDFGTTYLLPVNADIERLDITGIDGHDLSNFVRRLTAKVIVLINTRHKGRKNIYEIDRMRTQSIQVENGPFIIANEIPDEFREEEFSSNNGVFTRALLEGLNGQAVIPNEKIITIKSLGNYILDRVSDITHGRQIAQPFVADAPDFAIALKQ